MRTARLLTVCVGGEGVCPGCVPGVCVCPGVSRWGVHIQGGVWGVCVGGGGSGWGVHTPWDSEAHTPPGPRGTHPSVNRMRLV